MLSSLHQRLLGQMSEKGFLQSASGITQHGLFGLGASFEKGIGTGIVTKTQGPANFWKALRTGIFHREGKERK